MKLLPDPLGRPIPRLYFKLEKLDDECEQIVADFMDRHSGGFNLLVPTDDIIRMIENETDDLDMYADLPDELDGYTDFYSDRKPRVLIAKPLRSSLRKSAPHDLGHEFGHVRFHAPLWRDSRIEPDRRPAELCWTCHRDTIVTAPENDWMEWQTAYIGGALLMPHYAVRLRVREIAMREARTPPVEAIRLGPGGNPIGREALPGLGACRANAAHETGAPLLSIAELCRKEGINQNLYYRWSRDFLEAGKKRLAGDTAREAALQAIALGVSILAGYLPTMLVQPCFESGTKTLASPYKCLFRKTARRWNHLPNSNSDE